MKVIIVGGVAGGMSAATRLRRLDESAEIIVLEKGPYVSFANCGLPYHISGEIDDRSKLLVQTPEKLKERFNIDVRPHHEVIAIHPESHEIDVKNDQGIQTHKYDKLILSTGAKPITPLISGFDQAKNVFTLRNIEDMDAIMSMMQAETIKEAVVIGAGFIGLEVAENLAHKGYHVTIVEKAPQVLPPLDEEMAKFVQLELEKHGICVLTNVSAQAFEDQGQTILLDNEDRLHSDLTIMSIGVQPETGLAKEAGIELGTREAIIVNDHYETSQPDIYAVGDAILVPHLITKEPALISLASPANRQGRQVADVIAGRQRTHRPSIATAIVRVFDLAAASTGLNERAVKQMKRPYRVVHISGKHHAGYFPGAQDIFMKLIFHPKTGEIFGAQAIGGQGVDKRIDILATAIKAGLTVENLPELEFTYAPPFGSAKDPVNMIGYAALNLVEGESENIQWYELESYQMQGYQLLDVRTPQEIQKNGMMPNAQTIPLDSLRQRLHELDKNQAYIVSCHSGLRSYIAERLLKQHDYRVKNLDGAFALYKTVYPEKIQKN